MGNGGNVTKAMREMKYSENTINTPQKVTETKSWEMLCEEYLPDNLILDTHKEAFVANRVISARTMGNANEKTDDFIDVPDWQTRMKAVELGYKVRGKLIEKQDLTSKGEKIEINIQDYGAKHNPTTKAEDK